jgi:tetratricopeptide (TPR) repeat protein
MRFSELLSPHRYDSHCRYNLSVMLRAAFWLMFTGSLFAQTDKPEALAQAKLGLSHARKADHREAIQAYERAIAIDPNLLSLAETEKISRVEIPRNIDDHRLLIPANVQPRL